MKEIELPDGTIAEFPDDMSNDQISAVLRRQFAGPAKQEAKAPEWSDLPGNIMPSARKFVGGLAEMVAHPIDTLGNLGDLGAGALRAGVKYINPSVAAYLDRFSDPKTTARLENVASGAGNALADRYGGLPELKRTIIQDPVGFAGDASAIFTGGGALASKVPALAEVGRGLSLAGKYTDPLTPIVGAAKVAGRVGAPVIALPSGVGGENLIEAFRSGKEGGDAGRAFRENLTSKVSQTDVLTQAKEGLETIRAQRGANYTRDARDLMRDPTKLDTGAIARAAHEAELSVQHRGMPTVSPAEWNQIKGITDVVAEWRSRPDMTDVAGLDALKRRLDAAYPESPQMNQAQRIATNLRNTVKKTIIDQVPEYKSLMSDYEQSLSAQREIERGLSLGRKSSQDAAMRKLQSLARNNAQTGYGNRLNLAQQLKTMGGVDIMPAISGQAMSSLTPRGLQTISGVGSLAASAMHSPAWLATMPLQSPRVMGGIAHGMGLASPYASRAMPFVTPMQRLDALGQLELERRKKAQQANASRQNSAMGAY